MSDDAVPKESWHLSKSVPISLIMAIIVQTIVVTGAWFTHVTEFSTFKDTALTQFAAFNAKIDDRYRKSEAMANLEVRDIKIANLENSVKAIDSTVQQLQDRLLAGMERLGDKVQRAVEMHTRSDHMNRLTPDDRDGTR